VSALPSPDEPLRAPAKINLALRLGPRRSDGLHRIATVYVALDLHDVLVLEPAAETAVEGFPDDTLVRGALAALDETRRVRLEKRIPVAAGLGGGSSDAGAVLRAFAHGRDVNELYAVARSLGADVPFFLSGAPAAIGLGSGSRLTVLDELPRGFGVVLVPQPAGLSTADVYAAATPSDIFPALEGDLIRRAHAARTVADLAALVVNDLEPAVLALRPAVADALAGLRGAGALAAAVTGSGPTAFGLFPDRAAADRAAAALPGSLAAAPVE
jgi:4-diphosphocytidyl-2-C-methyl-D-erythritol kinase